MASLKSLTDQELRLKLKHHGITSPVTPTTRNILIKKLNHAIVNQKKASNTNIRARRSNTNSRLHTFSSDEDEDEDEDQSHSWLTSSSSGRSSRVSRARGNHHIRNGTRGDQWAGRTRAGREGRDGGGGGGGRESNNSTVVTRSGGRESNNNSNNNSSVVVTGSDGSTKGAAPRDSYRLYFPSVGGRSRLAMQVRSSEDYDTGSDSDPADLAEDSVDSGGGGGRSRVWTPAEPLPDSGSLPCPARLQNHRSGWVSEAGRARPPRPNTHMENGREWGEGEGVGVVVGSLGESVLTQVDPSRVANGRHHTEEGMDGTPAEESTWHYKVPLLLLVLLAVFFGVVAMLYVNMRMPLLPTLCALPAMVGRAIPSLPTLPSLPVPFFTHPQAGWNNLPALPPSTPPPPPPPPAPTLSPPPTQHTENKFPVCSAILKNNCLTVQAMALVQPVLGQLEEVVLPALHRQAGLYQCGDASTRHLPVNALQTLLHTHPTSSSSWRGSEGVGVGVVESLGWLVDWNPHWGLEAVRDKDKEGLLLGLTLSSHPTHILCHITTAIYSFLYLIMAAVTVAITAWLAFSCVRYYRWKAEEEKQQVYELVEQILEVLGGLGGASGKDFVAVNHVRDSLISPRDRRTKQTLWDRAVTFINCNESRVRREIQAVGGEDCEVWRWASVLPHHNHHHTPGGEGGDGVGRPPPKVWQGPAFNTLNPHNVPNVSPTSCLKIRNMFDCDVEFGERWPARIQDSILEKCEGISIVHVAVDRGSREGCVYLKCASLADSGRAFRALHGWWYDGNLVTVKFLRDERYHQRFPSARHATHRLRPSNNKRLSLQAPPPGQPESPPSHS